MGLIRSVATVGGLTMGSRVLGFVRDVLLARALGAGDLADVFFVALRFPNVFRALFAEGAFNAAFVPQFSRRLQGEGLPAARRFAEEALAVLLTFLFLLTVAAQAGMPWFIYVIAAGFAEKPEKLALAVLLTQITFPYLLFISLTALQGGILNSLYRFGHAAAAPIVLNLVMILALVLVVPLTGAPAYVLAWAVAVAGVGQFLWMVIACRRAGVALRLPWPRLTPGVRAFLRRLGPGLLGAGVMQLNLLVGSNIASFLGTGAIAYLAYADRIYQLPLAVVGSALGVVLLPMLSRALRAGDERGANDQLNRGLEFAMLLILPATVALLVIPHPVISGVFEYGSFTAADSVQTAAALAAYSLGLPAYVMAKSLTTPFFARENTATPFRYAVIAVAANIALSLVLSRYYAHVGIALATAAASWLNVGMLLAALLRRGYMTIDARLWSRLARILAASAGMGVALWLAAGYLAAWLDGPLHQRVAALVLLVGGGLLVYGLLALALGAVRPAELRDRLRRRPPAPPA